MTRPLGSAVCVVVSVCYFETQTNSRQQGSILYSHRNQRRLIFGP